MSDAEERPREIASQILPQYPYFHGPLMSAVITTDPAEIVLRFAPGSALGSNDPETAQRDTPEVTWTVGEENAERGGPLSPASFVALWNQGVTEVDGRTIRLDVAEDADGIEDPFVLWHPSGFYQAVRFRKPERVFTRQMLYPVGEEEV